MPLLLALPGVLTLYLAFNSGGLFEVTTAFAALVVLVVAAVAIAAAPRPLAGFSLLGALACGLLALFAIWTLLSAQWSDAGGRALVSFDRMLLYLAVLTLFACVPRSERRFRWLLRGLLAGTAAVALVGLASRLAPDLWPTATGLVGDRLNYPLTYWNTFALLVGMACILAVHHASDEREPPALRICGAALLPLLGATLLLTFSRGAIAVTVLAIVIYFVAAHPRGLLGGFLAAAPPTAIALSQTYSAQLIHEGTPLTPAAISEADSLLPTLLAAAIAAAVLRALALFLDDRVAELPPLSPRWRRRGWIAAGTAGAVVLVAFFVAGGPSRAQTQYDNFVTDTHETSTGDNDQRDRLLDIGNDGRRPLWEVARRAYDQDPLKGTGAGSFQTQWQRHRSEGPERLFAYSLYLETLAELGLVGIILLGSALLVMLWGIARAMRGPARPAYAAAFALAIAWVVHAGVDIDWQSPALCVPVFALGGLALARPREGLVTDPNLQRPWEGLVGATAGAARPALAVACLLVALVPGRMALAQTHLRDSVEALDARACVRAEAEAHAAISDLDTGPRPYEVLAMCAARQGRSAAAIAWAETAVGRDPRSWEPHYVLALAQGGGGRDPRRQIRIAKQADPGREALDEAVAALRGGDPQRWRREAEALPFAME
jgi:hypothetical protein